VAEDPATRALLDDLELALAQAASAGADPRERRWAASTVEELRLVSRLRDASRSAAPYVNL
jgi:hypothetical protein